MYCPSCGVESTRGLSHCRVCGANLTPPSGMRDAAGDGSPVKVSGAFIGLFLITGLIAVLGFMGIFGTLKNVRFMGIPPEDIKKVMALILVFSSATIVGVVALLSSVLMRVFCSSPRSDARPRAAQPRQIEPPPAHMHAPPAMHSVTEHTTRNFDQSLYRGPQK
jgi:hypothetical protein